jgi:hypothetical protein
MFLLDWGQIYHDIDAFSILIAYFRNSRPTSKLRALHLHLQTYI